MQTESSSFPVPNEVTKTIFNFAIQSTIISSLLAHSSPQVQDIDLGYFPPKDQESLTNMCNLCLVCNTFLQLVQPLLLKTVHLQSFKDIMAFHQITRLGAFMEGRNVMELSLGIDFRMEDQGTIPSSLLRTLSEIFGSTPNLTKLNLSPTLDTCMEEALKNTGDLDIQEHFWHSIPKSITHIRIPNPKLIPFIFQQNNPHLEQNLSRFSADHPHLKTWSIDIWDVIWDYDHWGPALAAGDFPVGFADKHLSKLFKHCLSIDIGSGGREDFADQDSHAVLASSFPNASEVFSDFVYYWPESSKNLKVRTIGCFQPTKRQLRKIFKQAPNISWFVYDSAMSSHNDESKPSRLWRNLGVMATFLKHITVFWDPQSIIRPHFSNCLASDSDSTYSASDGTVHGGIFPFDRPSCRPSHGVDFGAVGEAASWTQQSQTEAVKELETGVQFVYEELFGLQDRHLFPGLQDITLVLNPFPHYSKRVVRDMIGESLENKLLPLFPPEVELMVDWGEFLFLCTMTLILTMMYLVDARSFELETVKLTSTQ